MINDGCDFVVVRIQGLQGDRGVWNSVFGIARMITDPV